MSERVYLPGYRWFRAFRNVPVRLGVYIGVCLSVVFIAWLILANYVPFLERFALERNVIAAALLVFFALVPVVRFLRAPLSLLLSGLVCWMMFGFIYRILCFIFANLDHLLTTSQLLMAGMVAYLIAATLSWLGTLLWKTRDGGAAHLHNPMSRYTERP